jgi:hypothetical protein
VAERQFWGEGGCVRASRALVIARAQSGAGVWAPLWGRVGVGGGRYETCLAGVSEARSPPTLALPHKGGGDHKAFCTSVFPLIQRY